MENLQLIDEPHHFVEGVPCPYCKEPTIGIVKISLSDEPSRYRMHCMNWNCLTNHISPMAFELDYAIAEAFGVELPAYDPDAPDDPEDSET